MTTTFTILCPEINYGCTLDVIDAAMESNVVIEGTRQKWSRIALTLSGRHLALSSLVREQAGDKFSKLVLSLHTFFRTIPTDAVSNRSFLLSRIENVKMMIGVVDNPEFTETDDRLETLWHISESMNALIFNGDAALNLQGQRILDHAGKFDVVVE